MLIIKKERNKEQKILHWQK